MEYNRLNEISNSEYRVYNIFSYVHTNAVIEKETVRSKGQFTMQRFFYITGGKIEFVLNNKETITAKKGDVVYLPSDITYTARWEDTECASAISIQFELAEEGRNIILFDKMFIIATDKYEVLLKLFNQLVYTFDKSEFGYKIKCQTVFFEILHYVILEYAASFAAKSDKSIHKGILYIENNFMNEINVDEIASMCSMCASSFRRKFTRVTGMSPFKYKNYLKMRKAAEFLKTGEFTVSEVAYEVGINDEAYFNKLFKEFYNTSPGNFKKQYIDKNII